MEIGYDGSGLLTGIGTSVSPNLLVANPDQTQNMGLISTLEGYFDRAVDAISEGAQDAYEGAKGVIGDIYGGAKTVVGDVGEGAEHILGFTTNQAVVLVLAVGVGLYLAGKGGLLKGLHIG